MSRRNDFFLSFSVVSIDLAAETALPKYVCIAGSVKRYLLMLHLFLFFLIGNQSLVWMGLCVDVHSEFRNRLPDLSNGTVTRWSIGRRGVALAAAPGGGGGGTEGTRTWPTQFLGQHRFQLQSRPQFHAERICQVFLG